MFSDLYINKILFKIFTHKFDFNLDLQLILFIVFDFVNFVMGNTSCHFSHQNIAKCTKVRF